RAVRPPSWATNAVPAPNWPRFASNDSTGRCAAAAAEEGGAAGKLAGFSSPAAGAGTPVLTPCEGARIGLGPNADTAAGPAPADGPGETKMLDETARPGEAKPASDVERKPLKSVKLPAGSSGSKFALAG